MSKDLRQKLIYSVLFALVVYIAFVLWSDVASLRAALLDFPWLWMLPVVGLTLLNYLFRLLRWQWWLRLLDVRIQLRDTARVFGVGMTMVMTPGKAGELLKAYMVRNVAGAPMSTTAPTIVAERLIDGAAMILLAGVGLFAFPDPRAQLFALVVAVVFVAGVVVIQVRPLAEWALGVGARLPVVKKFANQLRMLYESSYTLFKPRHLIPALLVGVVSWGMEGIAYAIVLIGFGAPAAWETLFKAVFIFNISTVIGALLALPGGLGGVEGSMIYQSQRLLGLSLPNATAAALLTRFCTLWLGVGIGIVSIFFWHDLLAKAEEAKEGDAEKQDAAAHTSAESIHGDAAAK